MQNGQLRPAILFIAGLMGLFGVVSAAAASHGADPRLLGGASAMCLAHAPALSRFMRPGRDADGGARRASAFRRNGAVCRRSHCAAFPRPRPVSDVGAGRRADDARLARCRRRGVLQARGRLAGRSTARDTAEPQKVPMRIVRYRTLPCSRAAPSYRSGGRRPAR